MIADRRSRREGVQPPGADTVLVRYGELTVKSESVRASMIERLAEHVRGLLDTRDCRGTIDIQRERLYVHTDPKHAMDVTAATADAFGVASTSPAKRIDPDRESIEAAIEATAAKRYGGEPFAVRANRAGEEYSFTSDEIEEIGGTAVLSGAPADVEPTVDLDDPEFVVSVDVRPDDAYLFLDRFEAPGGFPYDTQSPVVALISGGIDSPVAAYELLRRGSPIVPVYLALGEYGGPDHEARAVETVRRLGDHVPHEDWSLLRVPAGESVAAIADALDSGRMLAFRRYMVAVAETIAREHDCAGIVTGEAIGQKSSQTASNLAVTSAATDLPVHRPLLAVDKSTIEQRARAIGTFRESTIPAGCQRFAPDSPAVETDLDRLRDREPDDLFERARTDAAAAEQLPLIDHSS